MKAFFGFILAAVLIGCSADVQLVNGLDRCSGTVLVKTLWSWGSVCDALWDLKDAAVVCRELNCGAALSVSGGSVSSAHWKVPLEMTEVECSGAESSLYECPHKTETKDQFCWRYKAAGVHCSGPDAVRLVNGPTSCSGRLEILHDRVWGTVCDDNWDQNDAAVACRQAGCSVLQDYAYNPSFGESNLQTFMGDLQCEGDEATLWQCPHRGYESSYCPTGKDAGVTCTPLVDKVRLVNSGDACHGSVEVRRNNQWGTVCSTDWDMEDAEVVCRELGCGSALRADIDYQVYQNGFWPKRLCEFQCTGSESSLLECPHVELVSNTWPNRRDGAVTCAESRPFNPEIHKVSISVDEKTANRYLVVSRNGKEIYGSESEQKVPEGPERFKYIHCVLGSEGFVSGMWYWEVTIALPPANSIKTMAFNDWSIGVAKSSVERNIPNPKPELGAWVIIKLVLPNTILINYYYPVYMASVIRKLGIFVIYEESLILFYNAETHEHLLTMTANFTEKIFPFFCASYGVRIKLS